MFRFGVVSDLWHDFPSISYGVTVFALALGRERRLEARGFEPLTSSLQSWRSTN